MRVASRTKGGRGCSGSHPTQTFWRLPPVIPVLWTPCSSGALGDILKVFLMEGRWPGRGFSHIKSPSGNVYETQLGFLMLTYFYSKTTLKELREPITYVERYTEKMLTVNIIVCVLPTHFLCICIHITCTYYIILYFFTQQHIWVLFNVNNYFQCHF